MSTPPKDETPDRIEMRVKMADMILRKDGVIYDLVSMWGDGLDGYIDAVYEVRDASMKGEMDGG